MESTEHLIDEIYRERIRRAREMSAEEKFFLGPRLFERACRLMADGIRTQFPEADDAQVQEILAKRLERLRRLEEP